MKRLFCALCALLLLSGCAPSAPTQEDTLTITATTYPLYLFALDITENIPNVKVERLDTGSVSCLHDYTLSVNDMKKIERSDVMALNGVGLEDFMSDALAATDVVVIDCSEGVELLPAAGHHDHDHGGDDHGHFDPHYWMDPLRAQTMVENLRVGLSEVLPEYRDLLWENTMDNTLDAAWHMALRLLEEEDVTIPGLITFHDGFQYFTDTLDLPLLRAVEEEAGSEASAKEMDEIIQLVKEKDIPVIFTETNGSDATANAIARETGCTVAQLSMIMDGREPSEDDSPTAPYEELFLNNVCTLINGFAGREVLSAP